MIVIENMKSEGGARDLMSVKQELDDLRLVHYSVNLICTSF